MLLLLGRAPLRNAGGRTDELFGNMYVWVWGKVNNWETRVETTGVDWYKIKIRYIQVCS